ncbi:hypothetical protein RF11_15837 [Thelohanellus kitauei]|uniref:Uncharacterized protein n=1 Tax=Thelohanellus kitauei TaxID=669202 RepID=A0A0C2I947_THEKT|nr:hypothetical protein RF11_15837 [Thelohanellus kitauei]
MKNMQFNKWHYTYSSIYTIYLRIFIRNSKLNSCNARIVKLLCYQWRDIFSLSLKGQFDSNKNLMCALQELYIEVSQTKQRMILDFMAQKKQIEENDSDLSQN